MTYCVKWRLESGKESKLHVKSFIPFKTQCGKEFPLHHNTVGWADAKHSDRSKACGKCFDI